ncbi:MAG: CxxC-x17-CxxC domain-containing protein [Candidatus Paceibacterota bacterium]|jgi:CxxC-x17-CxxC domain-containing protein
MKIFKRGNKSSERGGGGGFGGRDSGKRSFGGDRGSVMSKVICSDCKKECEVPFKPTGNRPVYCSDCFRNHDNDGGSVRSGGNNFRKPSFGGKRDSSFMSRDKQMFNATCDKCARQCEVPFKPTGDKPVYCSDCFEKNGSAINRSNDRSNDKPTNQYKEQFDAINAKLDRIMKILIPAVLVKEEKKELVVEKKEKTKKIPTKKPVEKKKKAKK